MADLTDIILKRIQDQAKILKARKSSTPEERQKAQKEANKNYTGPHRDNPRNGYYTIRFAAIKKTLPKSKTKKKSTPGLSPFGGTTKRKKVEIAFPAYIKSHSDKFSPKWSSEKVFNRPGPIEVFQGTRREISLEFDVPAGSDKEGHEVFCKLSELVRMAFYPSWEGFPYELTHKDYMTGFKYTIPKMGYNMKSAPMITMKMMNFIGRSDSRGHSAYNNGLHGRMKDLTFTPNMDAGVIPDYATGSGKRLYPVSFTVKLSFVVHHTHDLGFASNVDMTSKALSKKTAEKLKGRYGKSYYWPREGFDKFPYGQSYVTKKVKNETPVVAMSPLDMLTLAGAGQSQVDLSGDSRDLAQEHAAAAAAEKKAAELAQKLLDQKRAAEVATNRANRRVIAAIENPTGEAMAQLITGRSSGVTMPWSGDACLWWHDADDGCP
jgi:hypothetical protein